MARRSDRARICVALVVSVLGAEVHLRAQETGRASKIYAETSRSVFLLVVKSPLGGAVAQGTGFLVSGNRIITNEHVVRDGKVYVDLGAAQLPAEVERVDAFNDLAVVRVSAELSAKPLAIADGVPAPGASVYAIGNPVGLERSISTGVVSGVREFRGRQLLQVTSPISPGSSGGPIFNNRGEVVGVAVGILEGGQNLNFAVPATVLEKLLRGEASAGTDVASLIEKVDVLTERRTRYTYSAAPDSDWQKIDRQIDAALQSALERAGNNPDLLLRISQKAGFNDVEIGVTAAERAVRIKPTPEGNLALANSLKIKAIFAGDQEKSSLLERAEKAARAAMRAARQPTPEMYYCLADVLEDRASYAEAESNFRRALDASKAVGDAGTASKWLPAASLRGLVRVAYDQGKQAEGDAWFNSLVSTKGATASDWQQHGRHLGEVNRYEDAAESYLQAASLGGDWTNWCDAALFFSLAVGQEDSVLSSARRCVSEGAGKQGSESRLASAHYQIASVLNQRGVYQEALSHAKEASVLSPSDAWAFDAQAEALLGLRRFQEAINASNQAIRLSDGKFATMHFNLGSAYFEVGDWEFARQSFEKAAQLNPKDDAAAYNIALCFARLGYYGNAASWFEEVLRRNPNHRDRQDILNKIQIFRR